MAHLRYQTIVPKNLPAAPANPDDLVEWAKNLTEELAEFFRKSAYVVADTSLIGGVINQPVAAGFTVNPEEFNVNLVSTADVVSDVNVAVRAGAPGQILIMQNIGGFNITLKQGALVRFQGAVDRTMSPNGTTIIRWDGSSWIELGRTDT